MTHETLSRTVTVLNHDGFHLRAATLLVSLSRRFESAISVTNERNRVVDAKSTPLHLVGLDADQGDALVLRATGPDAAEALDALADLFASGLDGPPEDDRQKVGRRSPGRPRPDANAQDH